MRGWVGCVGPAMKLRDLFKWACGLYKTCGRSFVHSDLEIYVLRINYGVIYRRIYMSMSIDERECSRWYRIMG